MSSVDVVPVIAARLESVLGASRTVYRYGVPAGDLPTRYVVVRSSTGEGTAANLADVVDQRAPVVFVTSVAAAPSDADAAREAGWAQRKCVDALTDWRPALGRASWLPEHVSSLAPTRDDSLPGPVAYAVDQFIPRYQP
jgi:hypothetical protein